MSKFPDGDFGTECILTITETGMQLHADGEDPDGTSYLRVCDPDGDEILYWTSDEWKEEPELVIGAVIGALNAVEYATEARYGEDSP